MIFHSLGVVLRTSRRGAGAILRANIFHVRGKVADLVQRIPDRHCERAHSFTVAAV